MCDCGCNTCETKKPVMLNESIAPKEILSEGLKYHMDNNMPLTEHVYRAGSQSYFNLWAEARALYSRGILEVTGDDLEVLTETDLGHYGMFEGKKVPLDFPIELNELETEEFLAAVEDEFDLETLQLMKGVIQKRVDFLKKGLDMSNPRNVVKGYRGHLTEEHIQIIYEEIKEKLNEAMVDYDFSKEELIRVIKQLKRGASTEIGMIKAFEKALGRELTDDEIRGFKLNENRIIIKTKGKRLAIDKKDLQRLKSGKDIVGYSTKYPGQEEWVLARDKWEIEGPLKEAKKKAKKNNKKLNKPMRDSSGGKAYKVYVKDPKTKKIKTVRFGSGGLRAKINDKKARNAFAKRHNCAQKKDKTKAGYWSCRLPRYAKLLGLNSNFGGFW